MKYIERIKHNFLIIIFVHKKNKNINVVLAQKKQNELC